GTSDPGAGAVELVSHHRPQPAEVRQYLPGHRGGLPAGGAAGVAIAGEGVAPGGVGIAMTPLLALAVYAVGPGQPLATIADVPWATLAPGDTVLIHWRAQPYREKWVICRQGTGEAPITVRGVAGPGGELPVIDGRDATTSASLNFWNEQRGVIKIGGANNPPDTMPRHITIENLEVRSGRPP